MNLDDIPAAAALLGGGLCRGGQCPHILDGGWLLELVDLLPNLLQILHAHVAILEKQR